MRPRAQGWQPWRSARVGSSGDEQLESCSRSLLATRMIWTIDCRQFYAQSAWTAAYSYRQGNRTQATSSAVNEVPVRAAEREARGGPSAYLRLREAIVDGRFQPNERLVEADLARAFGAGRTADRAALVGVGPGGLVPR